MRLSYLWTCFWPGLTRLWLAGQWSGLISAFAFASGLNFLLAATFIWPEWLDNGVQVVCWATVTGFWAFSAYSSLRWLRTDWACQFEAGDADGTGDDFSSEVESGSSSSGQLSGDAASGDAATTGGDQCGDGGVAKSPSSAKLFSTAQTEYLKGHWFEAEAALKVLLSRNARDAEARLLWVSVLRRTGRLEAALRQLKALSRLETADVWALEIRHERRRVVRMLKERKSAADRSAPEGWKTEGWKTDGPSGVETAHDETAHDKTSHDNVTSERSVASGMSVTPGMNPEPAANTISYAEHVSHRTAGGDASLSEAA